MTVIETKFWTLTKISFWPQDFEKLEANKKNGWANLVVKTSQKTWQPYMVIDDFVPKKKDELDTVRAVFPEAERPDISQVPFR